MMRHVERELAGPLRRAAEDFAAVVVTGPRRAGKTVLLRRTFPAASYHLLEDPAVIARFRADPTGFLDGLRLPAILDEIQNVPELFAHVRARIDGEPRRTGRWFLTGSQEVGLMRNVTESMAGRAAVLQLMPMSARESDRVSLLRGGYPEVLARPRGATLWFASYLQTYLERDVRALAAIQDPPTFRRCLDLLATRHGTILNKSDVAAPLGVSVPTITRWLDILETTGQILLLPPYHENFGKRLVKSPRLYLADPGLACHLLGIRTAAELQRSPFRGALFEGLVASELAKVQLHRGERRQLWFYRDHSGLEVDFVMPGKGGRLHLIEAKATATPRPAMAEPLRRVGALLARDRRQPPRLTVVHDEARLPPSTEALAPGVKAKTWRDFVCGLPE